jgi:hypothetical protein
MKFKITNTKSQISTKAQNPNYPKQKSFEFEYCDFGFIWDLEIGI